MIVDDPKPTPREQRLRAALASISEVIEDVLRRAESIHGQHAGPRRPIPPSLQSELNGWRRLIADALAGKWPPTRQEYAAHYGMDPNDPSLVEMFKRHEEA